MAGNVLPVILSMLRLLYGMIAADGAATQPFVDLLAMHSDLAGCHKAEANLTGFDAENGDSDLVADLQRFAWTSAQDQHLRSASFA